jgi:hypothetical protein
MFRSPLPSRAACSQPFERPECKNSDERQQENAAAKEEGLSGN